MRRFLIAFFCLLFGAALPAAQASADPLDDRVRGIARQLRCPICESVSVADSPADLAVQMRGVIRKKLEAGESEQQIVDYFVTAYGDTVLLEPPRRGLGLAIWLGPLVAMVAGAAILAVLLRGWVRPKRAVPSGEAAVLPSDRPADDFVDQARIELDALRRGAGR